MKWLHLLINLQYESDQQIGVHVIDSWTYYALEFLNTVTPNGRATMQQFVSFTLISNSYHGNVSYS